MAKDCLGLMDLLSIQRAYLLGVSMGGLIAQDITINHAERVSKLVLSTCYCTVDDDNGPTLEMLRLTGLPAKEMLNPMAHLMLNNKLLRYASMPVVRWKNRMADAHSIESKFEACRTWSSVEKLRAMNVPTLVITGSQDRLIKPGSSAVIASLIPGSELVIIEGGSHMLFLEKSGHFNNAVLKFLKN